MQKVAEIEAPLETLPTAHHGGRSPHDDDDVALEAVREPLGGEDGVRFLDERPATAATNEAPPTTSAYGGGRFGSCTDEARGRVDT